jgi:hypothetical protein
MIMDDLNSSNHVLEEGRSLPAGRHDEVAVRSRGRVGVLPPHEPAEQAPLRTLCA